MNSNSSQITKQEVLDCLENGHERLSSIKELEVLKKSILLINKFSGAVSY